MYNIIYNIGTKKKFKSPKFKCESSYSDDYKFQYSKFLKCCRTCVVCLFQKY